MPIGGSLRDFARYDMLLWFLTVYLFILILNLKTGADVKMLFSAKATWNAAGRLGS